MRKIICAAAILMAMMIPCISYGATLNASVSSPDQVEKGDTFNVVVKFSAATLDMVDAELEYDSDGLSYISGGSSDGDGGIVFIKYGTDNGKDLQVTLSFRAKTTGTHALKLSLNEAYDMNGSSLSMKSVTRSVKVPAFQPAGVTDPDEDKSDNAKDDENAVTEDTDTEQPQVSEQVQEEEESTNPLLYIIPAVCILIILIIVVVLAVRRKKRR